MDRLRLCKCGWIMMVLVTLDAVGPSNIPIPSGFSVAALGFVQDVAGVAVIKASDDHLFGVSARWWFGIGWLCGT
jgi:hypothetical protein